MNYKVSYKSPEEFKKLRPKKNLIAINEGTYMIDNPSRIRLVERKNEKETYWIVLQVS